MPTDPTDPRLQPLIDKFQALLERVEALPAGGDLEALIEAGLTDLDQALYQTLLAERQHAAATQAAAFPPSALPPLRPPDAPGPT